MKHTIVLFTALLAPLATLHPADPGNRVLVNQSTFGSGTHQIPPNDNYGLGANSTANPIAPFGKCEITTKPELKTDAKGLPVEYSLLSAGKMMIVPNAENFRMSFVVANTTSNNFISTVEFRNRLSDPWGRGRCYRLDLVAGTLTKVDNNKPTLLAESKVPLLNGGKQSWPPKPADFSALEIIADGGKFQVRVAPDGKTWQDAIQCEDATPITGGAIWLNAGLFGDLRVEALPDTSKSQRISATKAQIQEAMFTSMEGFIPVLTRLDALDYLANLSTPVPSDISLPLALAVAQSQKDIAIRLAALRASNALQLKLDIPALLLDGLSNDNSILRDGAANALINLKLPPEQTLPKVVDALVKGDQFARFDVKKLISAQGESCQAAVFQEIKVRYAKAADARAKVALLKALSRDSLSERPVKDNPKPECLSLFAQALNDPSAEVRLTALKTLRWIESPLALTGKMPTIFSKNPEATAEIVKTLQAILKSDAPVAQRAEAVGCLAEMRQAPEVVIAALDDKDAAVRSSAAQGLCSFDRAKLQAVIPALQKLTSDAECKTDAEATLGYIQNEAAQVAGIKPLPSPSTLSPKEFLAETERRVDEAAKLSLILQAETIPFPNDFLSHYSSQLSLKRNREAANARLRQCLYSYSFNGCAGLDSTKTPFVYALNFSKSRFFPGGLTPETEEMFKETMFSYLDLSCSLFKEYLGGKAFGTENQSLQYLYGLWFMNLSLLNQDPAYASRKLRDGKTVAEDYEAWNTYMKHWLRARALNGFWLELGSGYCGHYSVPAVVCIYAAASDPETRQLAKMFLDLAMLDEAQDDFNDVRGANGNRNKGNVLGGGVAGGFNFFADGIPVNGKGGHQSAASGYRLPEAAILLREFEQFPKQPIVIANRRLGEQRQVSSKAKTATPENAGDAKTDRPKSADNANGDDVTEDAWLSYVEDSKAVSYLWKTRHYMLGSMLRDPKTIMGALYRNAPWNGILFADGKGLFPSSLMPEYFSFQHKNVFIFQRNEDKDNAPTIINVSPELVETGGVEENGWVFINHDDAYVGIKALEGGLKWDKGGKGKKTYVGLVAEEKHSPILIEAGDKDAFGSFDAFKAALQANKLTFSDNKVEYSGPKQPRMEFFSESTGQVSKVDGKPWSPDPALVYSGPFMQRKEGESVVTVTVGGRRWLYDFDKATITEADNLKASVKP